MTENMTVKEALDLAIAALDACKYGGAQQAAEMLRNGSAKVEKKESTRPSLKCNNCGQKTAISKYGDMQLMCTCWDKFGYSKNDMKKTWTEHEEVRIVTVKSKPVFEKVEETK